jgi:hypothetical protein
VRVAETAVLAKRKQSVLGWDREMPVYGCASPPYFALANPLPSLLKTSKTGQENVYLISLSPQHVMTRHLPVTSSSRTQLLMISLAGLWMKYETEILQPQHLGANSDAGVFFLQHW